MREKKKRATLNISKDTNDALDLIKRPGQSYDGIIRELIQRVTKGDKQLG